MLTVAIPEPANVFLLEEIERLSGFQVQVVAATARDIKNTLQTYLPSDKIFVIETSGIHLSTLSTAEPTAAISSGFCSRKANASSR